MRIDLIRVRNLNATILKAVLGPDMSVWGDNMNSAGEGPAKERGLNVFHPFSFTRAIVHAHK